MVQKLWQKLLTRLILKMILTEGGSSEGSYVTKKISLENPSTALDIRVVSVRTSSSIKMFFRTSAEDDERRIRRFRIYTI